VLDALGPIDALDVFVIEPFGLALALGVPSCMAPVNLGHSLSGLDQRCINVGRCGGGWILGTLRLVDVGRFRFGVLGLGTVRTVNTDFALGLTAIPFLCRHGYRLFVRWLLWLGGVGWLVGRTPMTGFELPSGGRGPLSNLSGFVVPSTPALAYFLKRSNVGGQLVEGRSLVV
jgi:hypothetical protein